MADCSLCVRGADIEARTFYDRDNWFAFLASPANLTGHAVLAVKSLKGECPQSLTADVLRGLDGALADVAQLLRSHYKPKKVLFASLRAVDPHVHVHVFPVSEADEKAWREQKGTGYDSGRFFEFLGDRERATRENPKGEWTTPSTDDVEALKALAS